MKNGSALVPADANDAGPWAALTIDEVDAIRQAARAGTPIGALARRYEVSTRTIYRYLQTPRWRCRECGKAFSRKSQIVAHVLETMISEQTVVTDPPTSVETAVQIVPAPVPPDFATHVRHELARYNMRPALLAYRAGIPVEAVVAIVEDRLCPDPETWCAIVRVIGTPAQAAQRREWRPVVVPRSMPLLSGGAYHGPRE